MRSDTILALRNENLSICEIRLMAKAWTDRQRILAKICESAMADNNVTMSSEHGKSYILANVLEIAGVSNTTLNRYAKLAGFKTPNSGQRYSADGLRAILKSIIANASDRVDRCAAMAKLWGITP